MLKVLAAAVGVGLAALASPASAGTVFGFGFINNDAKVKATANAVAPQLTVEVDAIVGESDWVQFTFRNVGGLASSIADIYFDDGTLLGSPVIVDQSSGVSFSQGAKPKNLPGGNSLDPKFETSYWEAPGGKKKDRQYFNLDSDSPTQPNGINPGEWLVIHYELQDGQGYVDTINALIAGAALQAGDNPHGTLRIGLHVQGMAKGYSASYVNTGAVPLPGNPVVPLPASVWAGLGLLGGLGMMRVLRRRRMADGL